MNKKIPSINESREQLRDQMRKESDGYAKQRLNALYLLKSQQTKNRQQTAFALGVHPDTVGRWLNAYQLGGIEKLLQRGKAKGKTPLLAADKQAMLIAQLQSPQGFGSYKEIQQFIATEYGVEMAYQTVHKLVRYKWQAKLKVPRKSHKKKR